MKKMDLLEELLGVDRRYDELRVLSFDISKIVFYRKVHLIMKTSDGKKIKDDFSQKISIFKRKAIELGHMEYKQEGEDVYEKVIFPFISSVCSYTSKK